MIKCLNLAIQCLPQSTVQPLFQLNQRELWRSSEHAQLPLFSPSELVPCPPSQWSSGQATPLPRAAPWTDIFLDGLHSQGSLSALLSLTAHAFCLVFSFGYVLKCTLKNDFIYLFLSALGLHCCTGFSLVAVGGLLIAVASLVAGMGSRALRLQKLQFPGSRAQVNSCGAQAQLPRGVWDLLGSGTERVSPGMASRVFTTEPAGKPLSGSLNLSSLLPSSSSKPTGHHCWWLIPTKLFGKKLGLRFATAVFAQIASLSIQ